MVRFVKGELLKYSKEEEWRYYCLFDNLYLKW